MLTVKLRWKRHYSQYFWNNTVPGGFLVADFIWLQIKMVEQAEHSFNHSFMSFMWGFLPVNLVYSCTGESTEKVHKGFSNGYLLYTGASCNRTFYSNCSVNSRWTGRTTIRLNHVLPAPKFSLKLTAWAPLLLPHPLYYYLALPSVCHLSYRPLQHYTGAVSAALEQATRAKVE